MQTVRAGSIGLSGPLLLGNPRIVCGGAAARQSPQLKLRGHLYRLDERGDGSVAGTDSTDGTHGRSRDDEEKCDAR